MQKIKQLPLHEAQKIAAGEVVERPTNVVKELIENAIDAGATKISVYLEEGGKKLIRVTDNGCGMSPEDAFLCFAQHATSKITTVDDLGTVGTFGFRGEALASIAAVSNVTLTTKEQMSEIDPLAGIQLKLDAGKVVKKEAVSCTSGTDIRVENLFYNVPARQKFLKKKETESRHITQLLHAFCLDYLAIHFTFFQGTKEIINCPAIANNDIISRITQLWDHQFAQQMITIQNSQNTDKITISGAISNHQYFRYDRNNIFLFVNRRWIKSQQLSRALMRGYMNVLPPARYPAACIFIEIDSQEVDINIHPRKEEVQFLHPRTVATTLQNSVKEALEQHLAQQIKQPVNFQTQEQPQRSPSFTPRPFESTKSQTHTTTSFGTTPPVFSENNHKKTTTPTPGDTQQTTIDKKQNSIGTYDQKDIENYNLIGQYKKTYILLERTEGLFIIDQHAVHERILYELFSKRFHDVSTVKLMFPAIVTVSSEDMTTLSGHLEIFKKNGIEIEIFGDNQLVIQSTPVHIKNIKLDELIRKVASWIREYDAVQQDQFFKAINEKMHAQMACKAAIKAGDTLTTEQMKQLLEDFYKIPNRLTCPHGRPTGWLLSIYEIEKRFKRT